MSTQFCERVGSNIRKYRQEKGITLKELAEKIGLTEATAQKYEAGNIKTISVEKLKEIADALGVRTEELTGWEYGEREKYQEQKRGEEEGQVINMYSQLTHGHKKAVRNLMKNLLECQGK